MPSMHDERVDQQDVRVLSFHGGAAVWEGCIPLDDGYLGIADIAWNSGRRGLLTIPLDRCGMPTGPPDEHDLGEEHLELVVPIGSGRAVLLTIERFRGQAGELHSWPSWYLLTFGAGGLKIELIESWVDRIELYPPPAVVMSGNGALLFSRSITRMVEGSPALSGPIWVSVSPEGRIALREGPVQPCLSGAHQFNFLKLSDGRLLSVFVQDWRSLYLSEVGSEGMFSTPRLLTKKTPSKGEIDSPQLFASTEGVFVAWGYNNGKKKRETRDFSIFVLNLKDDFSPNGSPSRLSPDREVVQWIAAKEENGAVLAWVSGVAKKGRHTYALRLKSSAELPNPCAIAHPFPDVILTTGDEALALHHEFIEEPYEWRLGTRVLKFRP